MINPDFLREIHAEWLERGDLPEKVVIEGEPFNGFFPVPAIASRADLINVGTWIGYHAARSGQIARARGAYWVKAVAYEDEPCLAVAHLEKDDAITYQYVYGREDRDLALRATLLYPAAASGLGAVLRSFTITRTSPWN